MLKSVRNLNLGYRIGIYTLAMILFGLLLASILDFAGYMPDNFAFLDIASYGEFLLPWLVCFGSGLASLIIVEPFRHPGGSPYGFLLGGATRTAPPLVLVLILVATQKPVELLFWIDLLFTYFFMLIVVLMLILPVQTVGKQDQDKKNFKKIEEKDETVITD